MRLSTDGERSARLAPTRDHAVARRRPVIEEIEPRILYSADFGPALLDAASVTAVAEHRVVDASGEFQSDVTQQHQVRQHEVVFVDTATPDYQALVDDIQSHSNAEHQVEVILLDRNADGIREITDTLSTRSDITAVHIIGHGADGVVELGKDALTFESLLENATQIKSWGKTLVPGADLLIYGCDVAQHADGRALVDALSRLTGADVSASEDLTGSAARGGNWSLEYSTGLVQTPLVISGAEQAAWNGILDLAASGDATGAAQATQTQVLAAKQGTEPTSPSADASAQPVTAPPSEQSAAAIQASVAATPLAFEQNVGQAVAQVDFLARGNGYAVGLAGGNAILAVQDGTSSQIVSLNLVGKNANTTGMGQGLLQSKTNYLVGGQDEWRTDIANFGAVQYDSVYDGIDVRYYGNQRQLEYDFLVGPGANVGKIQLEFDGVQSVSVAENGDLVLALDSAGHSIAFKAPVAYQDGPNGREAVASHYRTNQDGTVGFDVGTYDSSRQLVIDPVLSYATYWGGNGGDLPNGIAVDTAGNVYLTGYTASTGLLGGLLGLGGGAQAFVAKFSPNLGSLIYSTYVGGSNTDQGNAIAVDASGNAYVTGTTASNNFPTVSAYQTTRNGGQDAFVFKLDPTGSSLLYSTYLGGNGNTDTGWGIAIDASGSAYVTGAASNNFPTTAGAVDTVYSGGEAFVAKLNSAGNGLVYSTFIGGSGAASGEIGFAIAVDAAGNAVAVGQTTSSNFPTTANALQTTYGGGTDAFVTKLNSTGTGFVYSSYLGGGGADIAYNLALDSAGKIYLTGETSSSNFVKTVGAFQTTLSGTTDAFVSVIDPSLSGPASLVYSTYLGGASSVEAGLGVGVDAGGRIYVGGQSNSTDFPVTAGSYKTSNNGNADAFFAVIDPALTGISALFYGTYFGGSGNDYGDVATYNNGKFYLAGDTASSSGIATAGSYDTTYAGGGNDAFAAVFTIPPGVTTTAGSLGYIENAGAQVLDANLVVADPGASHLAGATLKITGNYVDGEDVLGFNNTNSWGITGTWNSATATLALTGTSSVANYQLALRSVTYQNTSENPSAASRTVTMTVTDGVLVSSGSTRMIAVTQVNDPPVNMVPGTQTTNEDSPLVFSSPGLNPISIGDVDVATGGMQVSLSVTNGVLTLARTTGLTFVTGNGTGNPAMTFTGTVVNINTALDGLRFDPAANFSGPASLQVVTNDQGNTGTGGPLTATNVVAINVTPVNDPPVNSVPGPQSTQEDTALVFSSGNGNAISVGDIDAAAGNLQITLVASNGTLTLGPVAGLTSWSGQGTSVVTFTGALGNLNTALNGLTFTPNAGFTGGASLMIATDDQGNSGTGGALGATNTLSIAVSPDVSPVITTTGSALGYVENEPATAVDPALILTDLDSPVLDHAIATVATGYVNGEDVLSFATQPGITGNWDAATGTLTLTGFATPGAYQTALRSVTYQNLSDNPSTATRTIAFVANDSIADGAVASRGITVAAINDPPVVTIPGAQSANEDSGLVFSVANGNEIRIDDPDAGSNPVQVALNASNGTLTLAQVSGLTFGAGSNGSGTMTVTGTIDDINAALNGLSFNPAADYDGPASVWIVTDDLGSSGTGMTAPSVGVVPVTVGPVNDSPQGADNTVTTLEDGAYAFRTSDFGFGDPNDNPPNGLLAVKISTLPGAGTLTNDFAIVNAGDFITASDIAAGKLRFTPAADANGTGYTAFTFQVQDDGATANGGLDTDATARTMSIDVTPVNDAPQGTDTTLVTLEDTPHVFSTADFGFSDPNDNPGNNLLAIKIATLPTSGVLTDDGIAITTGQFVSASDVAAGKLLFSPGLNASGTSYASFSFQVQDDGGTGGSNVDIDPVARTMTVTVTPVNDAPQGTDAIVTTLEDSSYTFLTSDFGFSDPNDGPSNGLLAVKISTLPGPGTLTNNLAVVNAGDFITASDIAAGNLRFTPAAQASGVGYTTFTFQVRDDGGTANGGADIDPTARTMTVNVTPVNDAPQGTSNTVTASEDTAYTFTAADFGFIDPDDNPANSLLAVAITNLPTAGSLTLSGVSLTAGQHVSVSDVIGGNLQFLSAPDASGVGYASFGFQVQDDGGTANGGVDMDPLVRTLDIDVTAVNDAPVNVLPVSQSTLLNTPIVLSGANAISVSDVDANGGMEQITLSVGSGTLTLGGIAGLTFTTGNGTGDTTVTFSGVLSDLNNALDGLRYTPASNYFGVDTLSMTSDDLGNSGTGGARSAPSVVAINVNYSAPAVTTSTGGISYTEKAASVLVDPGLVLTAGTLGDLTGATVQISSGYAAGEDALTLASQPLITQSWNPTTGTLVLSGTASVATYQAALQQVRYQDTSNDPSTATRAVTFTVTDGVTNQSAVQQVSVTAVNDAPTLAAAASNPTFQEAAGFNTLAPALNLFGSAVATTVEAGQTIIGLTFDVNGLHDGANETIVVDGSTITLGGNSSGTTATNGMSYSVTLSGTTAATVSLTSAGGVSAANVATLIDGIAYQNTNADNPSAGTRVFTLTQIQDSGGIANGGQNATTLTVAGSINVLAVNDAPANGVPGAQTTTVNTPLVFSAANGNRVGMFDVDSNAGLEQVTLGVTHGTLSLSSITGLTLVSGANGSASMTYRGTLANLNAALSGLTYTPANNYSGADTLSITSNDQGNTGSGGALTNTSTVGVTVNVPPPPPVVVPPAPPSAPPPAPSPGPSSPPTPAPPPSSGPPSPPSPPAGGGGTAPTGGSGAGGEPAQPIGVALAVDQTQTQGALVVGNFGPRGADLLRVQSTGPTFAAPATIGPSLGSLAIGSGMTQEAMLPGMQTETLTISSTDPEFARAPETVKLAVYRSTLGNKDWVGELNRIREDIVAEPTVEHRIVGSTVAVTGAMSVGYVIWLLRGGLLLSSLLSSLPAWHTIDPMPVLARSNNSEEDGEDDDPLENLFGRAKAAIGIGRARSETEAPPQPASASEKAHEHDETAAIPA